MASNAHPVATELFGDLSGRFGARQHVAAGVGQQQVHGDHVPAQGVCDGVKELR